MTTLDGVDSDYDGMRTRTKYIDDNGRLAGWVTDGEDELPVGKIFQGFKYDDLPPTFLIGDSLVYNQSLPEVQVTMPTVLDFDKEYPESEYLPNTTLQKWIRRIRQTTINKQLFPIYTSMEGMDIDVHDLTVEDMKGITFQIVPQFYWKYEWSYNEFMIHRVGKLNSTSDEIDIYDMLGNVWEWVRDDWSEDISELNGRINPIVGGQHDTWREKVIKGGAFDQLCRKTISPAREPLDQNKCMSKYATQANVGFRPALTFTAEAEGSGLNPGTDPIDLFFLFDASASQDSQISNMLVQAKKIVRYFSGDRKHKDVCHVGSALFLGPTLKFMCSNQCRKRTQKIWWTTGDSVTFWTTCKNVCHRVEYSYVGWQNNYPWKLKSSNTGSCSGLMEKGELIPDRASWVNGNDFASFKKGDGAGGGTSGLLSMFRDFRDNVWMNPDTPNPAFPKEPGNLAKRESFGGGGTGSSGGGGGGGGGGGCFKKGTMVALADGTFKDISEIKSGELVLSFNSDTNKVEASKVEQTMIHQVTDTLFTLVIGDLSVTSTAIHPFMLLEKDGTERWECASAIKPGDILVAMDGSHLTVSCVRQEKVKDENVYNLEVDGNHSYYVGDSKNTVLVHNKHYETVYPYLTIHTTTYHSLWKNGYFHCGVPAWREDRSVPVEEDTSELHFGEIPMEDPDDKESDWGRYNFETDENQSQEDAGRTNFSKRFPFFTYELSKDGIKDFQSPFWFSESKMKEFHYEDKTDQYNGALSNWFSGVEPTCDMLGKLIGEGFFFGEPWNAALGYVFRKNTPKLIIVFSNEFDNAAITTYDKESGLGRKEIAVVMEVDSKNKKINIHECGFPSGEYDPLDPYCLQILKKNESQEGR